MSQDFSICVGFQREIKATDREIGNLLYKLYGLTEEEIRIMEAPYPHVPDP